MGLVTVSDITHLEHVSLFRSTTHQYLFQIYLTMISILKSMLYRFLSKLAETTSTQKRKPKRKANCVFLYTQLCFKSYDWVKHYMEGLDEGLI